MGERQRDLRERIILDIRKETGVNNKVHKFFAIVVSLCMMFASSMTVLAENTNKAFNAEQYAAEELNTWAEKNGTGVKFENFHITPPNDNNSN